MVLRYHLPFVIVVFKMELRIACLLAWCLHVASVIVTTFDSSLDLSADEEALAYFLVKELHISYNETC